ncbi:MAG: CARDB domain-containing protein [Planctomycetaceae bacterium]
MQKNAIWKLAALAGVVAVGFFAVLQTQRGLRDEGPADPDQSASKSSESKVRSKPAADAESLSQFEPTVPGNPFSDSGDHVGAPDRHKDESGAQSDRVPTLDFGKGSNGSGSRATSSNDTAGLPFPATASEGKAPPEADGFQPKGKQPAPTQGKTVDKASPLFDPPKPMPGKSDADTTKPLFEPNRPVTNGNPDAETGAIPSPFDPVTPPGRKTDADSGASPSSAGPQLFGPGKSAVKPTTTPNADSAGGSSGTSSGGNPFGEGSATRSPMPLPPASSESQTGKTPFGETGPFDAPPPEKADASGASPPASGAGGPFAGDATTPRPKRAASSRPEKPTSDIPTLDSPDTKKDATPTFPDNRGAKQTPPKSLFDAPPGASTDASPNTSSPPSPGRLSPTPDAAPIAQPSNSGQGGGQSSEPQQRPQLTITKSAPKNAVLGKAFVYDIVIHNRGKRAALKVVVTDPVPGGVRLEGTDPQAVLSNNKLRWKLGTLKPGVTRKISVKVTPVRAGQIGSVATVNFVAAVSSKTVVAAPKLVLDAQGPRKAKVGQQVTFRFKVTNAGNSTAKDVWLRDIIPDGLKHSAGNDLEYNVGTLAPGKTEDIKLSMTVTRSGEYTNRAVVTAAGGVRIEKTTAVTVPATRIVIARSGPNTRYVGRHAIYQNTVSNGSTETIESATITEAVPLGMKFVKASDGGKYEPSKRTVTWVLGPLRPQKGHTVTLTLLPQAAGVQHSIVSAVAADGTSVRTASATRVEGYAVLAIDATPIDRPVRVGEQVTLRIIGRNRGSAAASNVKMKVTLPKQLRLVTARGKGKYRSSGDRVSFEPIASLGGKEKIAYDLVLKAVGPGDARVNVQIQSSETSKPLSHEEAVLVLPNE